MAGAEALIGRDGEMTHPDGSARRPGGGHYVDRGWRLALAPLANDKHPAQPCGRTLLNVVTGVYNTPSDRCLILVVLRPAFQVADNVVRKLIAKWRMTWALLK
jgi:hypothetical protein